MREVRDQDVRAEEGSAKDYSYKPSKKELLKNYQINIEFLSVGCIIRVGCESIAFESLEDAMSELHRYVDNPEQSIAKWRKLLG
jgi:ethanolamine utilization cobalamin adenosyltransferase